MINQYSHTKQQIQQVLKGRLYHNEQNLYLNKLALWRDVLSYKNQEKLKVILLGPLFFNAEYCTIKEADVEIIVAMSTSWANLQKLNIQYCKIESTGANMLWKINCPKLNEFKISGNNLSWLGLQQISTSNLISQLKVLDLCKFFDIEATTQSAAKELKQSTKQTSLDCNNFMHTNVKSINNQGFVHLGKVSWPKLNKLDINKNEISNQAILSILNFDFPVATFLTFLPINNSVNLVHLVASNIPRQCGVQACNNPNKSIRTSINSILKFRVNILFDGSNLQDDSLSYDSSCSSSSSFD